MVARFIRTTSTFLAVLSLFLISPLKVDAQNSAPEALNSLDDKDIAIRERALDQLLAGTAREARWVESLLPLVQDPSSRVREKTVRLLGEIGNPNVIPALLPLAKDGNSEVRQALALALTQLNAHQATAELIYLSRDPSEEVAIQAIHGLESFADPKSVKSLTDLAVNGDSYRLRSAAIQALAKIPSQESVPKLVVLLEVERDIWLRLEIARTLSQLGDEQAIKPMMRTLAEIRREANEQNDDRRKDVYNEIAAEFEKAIAHLRQHVGPPTKQKPTATVAKAPSATPAPISAPSPEITPTAEPFATAEIKKEEAPTPPPPPPKQKEKVAKTKTPPAESPKKSKAEASNFFTIQIKSTPDAALANELAKALKEKGEKPFIVEFKKGEETWHRVRLGRFKTIEEAETYAQKLKERTVITEYFITR